MKRLLHFITLLLISGLITNNVLGQDDDDENEDDRTPRNLFSFVIEGNQPYAIVGWNADEDDSSYIVRVYRASDGALYQELQNVILTIANVTNLQSGTNYSVTVAAVYFDDDDRLIESPQSMPTTFGTRAACTGRRERVPCTAHCISTCGDPDPVCSRECVPGCGCPAGLPIWYQNGCIPRVLCPPPTGSPVRPNNLQVERGTNGETIVVWEPVENAVSYTVQVRETNDAKTLVRSMESPVSIVLITGLNPNEVYAFSVAVTLGPQNDPEVDTRFAILPPDNIFHTAVTNTSFRVQWTPRNEAVRYVFVLYDESSQTTPIYTHDKVPGNIINVASLNPGTTYYYSVASARRESDPGIFSPLAQVTTGGVSRRSGLPYAAVVVDIPESTAAPTTTTTTTATTTTTTTTSATTTTAPLTLCLQEQLNAIEFFSMNPDGQERTDRPRIPVCDLEGLYMTEQCGTISEGECFCVDSESGVKIRGTDFGGINSEFEINCDQIGNWNATITNLRADVRSTSITLTWDPVTEASGYNVVVENEFGVEIETRSVVSPDFSALLLVPDSGYTFEIFAVNFEGATGPMTVISATTLYIDTPTNVQVTVTTVNSVTVSWNSVANADYYEVVLIFIETNEVVRNISTEDSSTTSLTISNLFADGEYRVEIRAVAIYFDYYDGNGVRRSEAEVVEFALGCQLPPLDLLYVIDSSQNTGWLHLQDVKGLLRNITEDVAPVNQVDGTRVSVVKYYRISRTSFSFTRFNSSRNVFIGLDWLSYNGGRTRNVSRALEYVMKYYFSSAATSQNQPRPNARSIVIFVSVGEPDADFERTQSAAESLAAVANVISVGVAGESDDVLLDAIASRPDLKVVAPSFDDIRNLDEEIIGKFCSLQ